MCMYSQYILDDPKVYLVFVMKFKKRVSYLNLCAQRRQNSPSVRLPRHFYPEW